MKTAHLRLIASFVLLVAPPALAEPPPTPVPPPAQSGNAPPQTSATTTTPAEAQPAAAPVPAPPPAPVKATRAEDKPGGWKRAGRITAYAGLGAAAALLASSVVAIGFSAHYASQWNDDSRCLANGRYRIDNCLSIYNHSTDAQTIAVELATAGGAVAIISVVLLLSTRPASRADKPRPAVSCGPGPGALGVACIGSF